MRKIKVVVLLVQQLQHGFTKNAKVSPNLTVAHIQPLFFYNKFIYFACSALELSDTIYQKHQLRCDHSVTISQRSGRFRNGVVYIFREMYSLMIHFGIK